MGVIVASIIIAVLAVVGLLAILITVLDKTGVC